MKISIEITGRTYQVIADSPIHISIPMLFNGQQPNTYDLPAASAQAYEGGGFIGDVRRGGGCNFETYQLTPHCNGTHTECIGHITGERISVHRSLCEVLIPATLITVTPIPSDESKDRYSPALNEDDMVIDRNMLELALHDKQAGFHKALIIRTLPNPKEKMSRRYAQQPPAFFTLEAMHFINSRDIKHLLIDLPSVDRTFDEGQLSTHHIFWNIPHRGDSVSDNSFMKKTITEMIYVPDAITDGTYLLNLQIAPFEADASPSRPVLFKITENE